MQLRAGHALGQPDQQGIGCWRTLPSLLSRMPNSQAHSRRFFRVPPPPVAHGCNQLSDTFLDWLLLLSCFILSGLPFLGSLPQVKYGMQALDLEASVCVAAGEHGTS